MLSLLNYLRDDDVSVQKLIPVARNDPVITGAIISAANQIRRNRQQPDVADPLSAASLIGLSRTKNIIVAVGMNRENLHGEELAFYHHSQCVAKVTKELATLCDVDPEHAYAAGMLHDIGQLCFHVTDTQTLALASKAGAADGKICTLEALFFGLNHSEVGAQVAEYWCLPDSVISAIRTHHDDKLVTNKLWATINDAESLTQALDLPHSASNRVASINEKAVEESGINWQSPDLLDCIDRCRALIRHAVASS